MSVPEIRTRADRGMAVRFLVVYLALCALNVFMFITTASAGNVLWVFWAVWTAWTAWNAVRFGRAIRGARRRKASA